jgi:outer membrane protein OmpA-like peptidoglycan-associated protein
VTFPTSSRCAPHPDNERLFVRRAVGGLLTAGEPDHKTGGDHHADALAELRAQAEQLSHRIAALTMPSATAPPAGDADAEEGQVVSLAPPQTAAREQAAHEAAPAPPPAPVDRAGAIDEEGRRPGVRLSDLPSPVSKRSRVLRALWALVVLLLVAGAFLGGMLWTEYQREQAASPPDEAPAAAVETQSASREAEATTDSANDPEPIAAAAAGESDEAAAENAPTTTVPVDPTTVLGSAEAALTRAGYTGLNVTYSDGTLYLDGVIPTGAAAGGYSTYVDAVSVVIGGIAGVDSVTPRLFLRGDGKELRAELRQLVEDRPIEFEFADLVAGTDVTLPAAAEAILSHPGLRVLVAGHSDSSGSAETNAALASARAEAVIRELVALGVPVTRLDAVAYGELFPDADGSDEQNRRVEFEVSP